MEYLFGGAICQNYDAFKYLKDNGFINMGICPRCGETAIGNSYKFTDGFNHDVQYYLCQRRHNSGRKLSINPANDKKGCYIATVCYEDYQAKEVITFRNYRDNKLSKSFYGRFLVYMYYLFSPRIAIWLSKQPKINRWVKEQILNRIYKKIKSLS
jgi:hypothetical protein